jgi:uroporphyrinogen decarboxylase
MDECRRQIDVLAKDGGYILAPGCEYPPNIPLTNAFAMVKAAEMYG